MPLRSHLFPDSVLKDRWLNLTLFTVAILEGLYLVGAIRFSGLFSILGADFRALYAAIQVARSIGFDRIYDPQALAPVQRALCAHAAPTASCVFIPMVFPPAFVALALPIAWLDPVSAFFIWSVFSMILTIITLYPSVRDLPPSERWRLLALAGISYPFFATLFWGQVNAILLFCLARFQDCRQAGKDLRAGLWLGGLLWKPQTLILLLPGLALARQWKTLAGFGISAAGVLALSAALSGRSGIASWLGWLIGFARPHPALTPTVVGAETMLNWRALGAVLPSALPDSVRWGLIGIGMVLTALPLGIAWWRSREVEAHRSNRLLLGTMAATLTVSWHAHAHTAMLLMRSLLAAARDRQMPLSWIIAWGLLPAAMPFAGIVLDAIGMPMPEGGVAAFAAARLLFLLHLAFTAWSVQSLLRR